MTLIPTPSPVACTSAGCFLQKNGGLVSFPLVTLAGLVDGVNPCAIGMLVLLLGYLIVFAGKAERVFKIGLFYILSVYLTYLLVGVVLYESLSFLSHTTLSVVFKRGIGGVLLLAGLLNLKDFVLSLNLLSGKIYKFLDSFHLEVPGVSQGFLRKYIEKTSIPATVVLGVLVTLLETPCSLPIYIGTATILAQSGLPRIEIFFYFLYYNLLFVFPLILLWLLIYRTKQIMGIKEWEHKAKKWMKLSLGMLLVIMGVWMFL